MPRTQITASVARELLARHNLVGRRSLGQHFLVDPNTVRRIVRLADIAPDETILEVGPGLGSLTLALAERAARVVAVEVDPRIAAVLREVVADRGRVEVVVADAVRADLGALLGQEARLVANLPYNVATPIVARVLEGVPEVTGGLVMAQRELGERWTASPGSKVYGAISVKVAYHAEARVIARVPKSVFLPPPKVESVLVAFGRRSPPVEVADARAFLRFVEAAFGQRRKTIRNALVAGGRDRAHVESALEAAAIAPSRRPEELGIDEFAALYEAMT